MHKPFVFLMAVLVFGGTAYAQGLAPAAPKPAEQRKNFKDTDIDRDNRISRNEWRYRSDNAFKAMDGNADGYLSFEEIKWFHEKNAPLPDKTEKLKERTTKPAPYVDPNAKPVPKKTLRDRLGNLIDEEEEAF